MDIVLACQQMWQYNRSSKVWTCSTASVFSVTSAFSVYRLSNRTKTGLPLSVESISDILSFLVFCTQGALRVSRFNPFEGWVGSESVGQDILISGRIDMNRYGKSMLHG